MKFSTTASIVTVPMTDTSNRSPVSKHNSPAMIVQLAFLMLILLPTTIMAIALPTAEPVPGGIAIVPFTTHGEKTPVVQYNGKRVMVVPDESAGASWLAITGIPLAAKPGRHSLSVNTGGELTKVTFDVKNKDYETQHLTIKNKRKVNPYKKDLVRIGKEKILIRESLAHWSDGEALLSGFQLPVNGRLSSPFGLRRVFNKQPRKPHSGIDIAAPSGTIIVSPTAGTILRTGEYFFNGNSVFIDHGQGLVTMYCHMSRIDVKPGQKVASGETIGAVGQTGRVTGPHLHWGVSLNDARVDPSLFFDKLNQLLSHEKK